MGFHDFKVMTSRRKNAVRLFQHCYYVYILSSLSGMLYTGLTDDLKTRIMQHKDGTLDGFTKRFGINRLYFETITDHKAAEHREQQIKKWPREKKIALFTKSNPQWKDLTAEIFEAICIPRYARDFREKPVGQTQGNHTS